MAFTAIFLIALVAYSSIFFLDEPAKHGFKERHSVAVVGERASESSAGCRYRSSFIGGASTTLSDSLSTERCAPSDRCSKADSSTFRN
jgi:hypothetical protein